MHGYVQCSQGILYIYLFLVLLTVIDQTVQI